jgi:hypothetical protein
MLQGTTHFDTSIYIYILRHPLQLRVEVTIAQLMRNLFVLFKKLVEISSHLLKYATIAQLISTNAAKKIQKVTKRAANYFRVLRRAARSSRGAWSTFISGHGPLFFEEIYYRANTPQMMFFF